MSNELLLSMKNHIDTLIEQTKSKPQETLEFQMNRQIEAFSFNPPINLAEEEKCLFAVTGLEAMNSLFNINDENNSFSITIPGYWTSRGGAETIIQLQNLVELREQNDIELHVEEVRKRGNRLKIGDNEHNLSDLDTRKRR